MAWDWASPVSFAVFVIGALALVAFVLVERRAAEPVLPLWVFSRRVLIGGNLAAVAIGVALIGLTSYVPTYVQGVLGTGALVAGFALAAMVVGWPISAALSGRVYLRIGFRDTALIGSVIVVLGAVLVALLTASSPVLAVAGATFVIGIGFGLAAAPTIVAVQSVVDWQRRGVVTGTNLFCRNLGSAVGVAVFGAIANHTIGDRAAHSRSALFDASHNVFLGVVASAVVLVGVLWLMPRKTEPLAFEPVNPRLTTARSRSDRRAASSTSSTATASLGSTGGGSPSRTIATTAG